MHFVVNLNLLPEKKEKVLFVKWCMWGGGVLRMIMKLGDCGRDKYYEEIRGGDKCHQNTLHK